MRALPGLVALIALIAAPALRAQQLVVGIDDATQGSFMIDANTGASIPVMPAYGPSSMAVDLDNVRVVFTVGSSLYSASGGTTAALGQVQYQGTPISPAGMGWYNGRVYFTTVDGIEGLYWLSLTNGQATLVAPFPSAATANVGGFDIDVSSGRFFGTNDNASMQGLVEINPVSGALTLIAPYPPGEDDVDGLAAGDGRLFLITDDDTPNTIPIYDIDEGAYSATTLPNPFTGSHVSSAGAYIPFPYQSLADNGGYSYRTCHAENGPTSGFVDIAATGEPLSLADDGETNLTLPFSFPFYGTSSTGIRVGNNGGIMIGATTGDWFASNTGPIPIATLGASVMPFWDDIDSDSGDVYWQTFTTCPNPDGGGGACAIVQWNDRPHFSASASTATFQALLYANGSVLFNYLDVDFGNVAWDYGASATIGIQGPDPTPAAKQFQAYAFDRVKAVRENCPILFNRIASIRLHMYAKQDTDGIPGNECGITDNLMVAPGSTVEVCHSITNTGVVTLTRHDLTSNAFGTLLQNFPYSLAPGASAFLTQSTVINGPTWFTGQWTAYNPGPLDVVASSSSAFVNVTGPLGWPIFHDGFESAPPMLKWIATPAAD